MKKGFSMLELMVVIIIIGVLASVGITYYGETVERSRESEAKALLGQIRTAFLNYQIDHGYPDILPTWEDLGMNDDYKQCDSLDRYFMYSFDKQKVTATRCINGKGKPPSGPKDYKMYIYMANGTVYKED